MRAALKGWEMVNFTSFFSDLLPGVGFVGFDRGDGGSVEFFP